MHPSSAAEYLGKTVRGWRISPHYYVAIYFTDGTEAKIAHGCCDHCDETLKHFPDIWEAVAKGGISLSATERSKKTFERLLPATERKRLNEQGFVTVKGSASGASYAIRVGASGNVNGNGKHFCCYVDEVLPTFDHMTAQYLAIKYNEEHFIQTAFY